MVHTVDEALGKPLSGMPAGWKLNDSGLWVKAES